MESKIREGISVEVDYDGGSYEADIVKMHGKFNYLNVYIYLFCIFLKMSRFVTVSLGPVHEFACISFKTGNLNCFRVK